MEGNEDKRKHDLIVQEVGEGVGVLGRGWVVEEQGRENEEMENIKRKSKKDMEK